MSGHAKAFVVIIALGLLAILGARFVLPIWQDQKQRQTSDAAGERGSLVIGIDSWVGYFPLCSPAMVKRMRAAGYNLNCEDDKADYAGRFARLDGGELQFAVATVDAYLLNGAATNYPGAIIAVLDQSTGGDAIVARRSAIANLDALKKKSNTRVAFTPNSPSEHLLKAVGVHFDVPQFRERKGPWRVIADGSSDALDKLESNASDVAVLWEPDVSRALANPEFVKLIGTDDTANLIVDVLIASRAVVRDNPEAITALLTQYFQALREYRDDPALLRDHVRAYAKADAAQVDAMLRGVAWASLADNGLQWMGGSAGAAGGQELIDTINGATQILIAAGDFDRSPLPDRNPSRLTNGHFIAELFRAQSGQDGGDAAKSLQKSFGELDDAGWARLQEVGTLKIEPITFQRGTATLQPEDEQALARIADRLRHYPKYRILVKGHTGLGGDADANLELSKSRAQTVANHLLATFQIDPNRVRAVGYGASQPLPRLPDESDRAYGYRLPRVEVALVAEQY